MKTLLKPLVVAGVFLFVACHSEPTLQKYFVKHQNDNNFIILDLPINLFYKNIDTLPSEYQNALRSIRKANVMALPLNGDNKKQYYTEKRKITHILQSGDYKLLFKMKFSGKNLELRYLGSGDTIDEFVVLGCDDQKGFIVARLLGDHMKPETLANLWRYIATGKVDMNWDELENIFHQKAE